MQNGILVGPFPHDLPLPLLLYVYYAPKIPASFLPSTPPTATSLSFKNHCLWLCARKQIAERGFVLEADS
nr:hypothetical protein CFP56_53779 [Quercus suber]